MSIFTVSSLQYRVQNGLTSLSTQLDKIVKRSRALFQAEPLVFLTFLEYNRLQNADLQVNQAAP